MKWDPGLQLDLANELRFHVHDNKTEARWRVQGL